MVHQPHNKKKTIKRVAKGVGIAAGTLAALAAAHHVYTKAGEQRAQNKTADVIKANQNRKHSSYYYTDSKPDKIHYAHTPKRQQVASTEELMKLRKHAMKHKA